MEHYIGDFKSYKLHIIKTNKFKTVSMKIVFSSIVKKENITITNFLADILTFSSKKYPTKKDLGIALQDLYAMNAFSNCYRIGKLYNMDISTSFLNEKYTEEGCFEKSIKLLSELVFNPNFSGDSFDENTFNIIKRFTADQINSISENTRKLSLIKMLENMGSDKTYSYHGYGYIEDLNKITPKALYEFYKRFMSSSKIDIYVLGDVDVENTKSLIRDNFGFKSCELGEKDYMIYHDEYKENLEKIEEPFKVSQSKLSIGCKIEKLNKYESNYVLPIYTMILGGGSDSKMFREIREKKSLCYYISATANKLDNILFITSGISSANYDMVLELVKKNMDDMKKGDFSSEDIEKAKLQYVTMLDELQESAFQIISSYYSIDNLGYDSIETRKEMIKNVSYEEIKSISSKIHLDTAYLLKGEE